MSGLDAEIIIIGGGLAGNTLAGLLGRKGLQCSIVEAGGRHPGTDAACDPRVLAITPASQCILAALEVWQRLPAERYACFRGMHVWDENGNGEIDFDSADLCQPTLGYTLELSLLQGVLEQMVDFLPGVTVHQHTKLQAIHWHDDHISVTLDNGEILSAQLLVAADGAGSTTRKLAGINCKVHDYRQQAVAAVVNTTLPHGQIARQRFLTNGPLAFLPMYADEQCAVIWSTGPEHAEKLLQMTEKKFNQSLQEAFDHTLGEITASENRGSFTLRRAEAVQYCKARLALIGDAAHSVHPLAGQGANLGLLDAASLAQLLVQAKEKNRDIAGQRVLRAYERWRKGENKMMMMILEGFKYIFETQSSPVPLLRNKALDFANAFIPLKHTVMRYSMGLAGDLPAVARGNSI